MEKLHWLYKLENERRDSLHHIKRITDLDAWGKDTKTPHQFFYEMAFSMSYLKNMPVTTLKIDKSFVLNLHENIDDQTIVQVIIDLAKRFDLELVAEGVENEIALQMLKTWGCDFIQGYHISRPVDGNSLLAFLTDYEQKAEK